MTTYRLQFAGGADSVRILADEGKTEAGEQITREIATTNGRGNRWPQAVKDAELIVSALNTYAALNAMKTLKS